VESGTWLLVMFSQQAALSFIRCLQYGGHVFGLPNNRQPVKLEVKLSHYRPNRRFGVPEFLDICHM
jgi:hypothetical protein